ncbi:MAG: arylsulfatase [Rikenellaceae bacterium]
MKLKSSLLLPLALMSAAPLAAKQKPNIIFILADDLGYGDLECYNPDCKIPTQHLNQMAENGVKFTDAHTSSGVSTPTRYGIITGRYNWRSTLKSGVLSGTSEALIDNDRTTVADVLKHSGYSTAAIGKWHLGWNWAITEQDPNGLSQDNLSSQPMIDFSKEVTNSPNDLGFDYYYAFCGSLDMPPYVWVENNRPTDIPTNITVNKGLGFWRKGLTADDFNHYDILQDVADKAMWFIENETTEENPFFVYMPLPAPHTPILPSDEFKGKSQTTDYGDYVMQVDDVVGQIRSKLEELGISDDTILIFTSDNGCSTAARIPDLLEFGHSPNGVLRGNKADLYEGGHRVPYIVEWGNGAKAGSVAEEIICTTDLFATAAEITGYKIQDNEGEDSFSFLPSLKGRKDKLDREYTIHHSISGAFAIRSGEWKLLFSKGSAGWSYPTDAQIIKEGLDLPSRQLYNLNEDISETTNVIDSYPKLAAELTAALQKIITDGRSTKGATQQNDGADEWPQLDAIFGEE